MNEELLIALIKALSPKGEEPKKQTTTDLSADFIDKYCLIRTYNAGVFVGYLSAYEKSGAYGDTVIISDCRRVWKWEGALECIKLSEEGFTSARLSVVKDKSLVTNVIEIHVCSDKAAKKFKETKADEK